MVFLSDNIGFIFPLDGDCLTPLDGELRDGSLFITVQLLAYSGASVTIDGTPADELFDGVFSSTIPIGRKTDIIATVDGRIIVATVYQLDIVKGYRLSVDDNIRFLAELTQWEKSKNRVASIFDHPYLRIYKEAHDLYGAAIHLNLFYEAGASVTAGVNQPPSYFNLSMMTNSYKAEWEANSDWLKLSFHSRREFPAFPYKYSARSELTADYEDVKREILRFAGEPCFSEVTTIHYGSCSDEGLSELKRLGVKTLMGIFELDQENTPIVGYDFPPSLAAHIANRDFFYSSKYGMLFGRIDIVLNNYTVSSAMEEINKIAAIPTRAAYLELMIHEQYFYPDYKAYIPDFRELVLSPCKWAYEHDYKGMDEVICRG